MTEFSLEGRGPGRASGILRRAYAVSLPMTYVAAFALGFGLYKELALVAIPLGIVAVALRWRHFLLDAWHIAFLLLLVAAYFAYRADFIQPPMFEGAAPMGVRLYAIIVSYFVLGYLLATTAGSRRATLRVVVVVSLGMLAKASMLLIAVMVIAEPPYYNVGGYDPIAAMFINPNNVNDIAVYATWTLIAFVIFDRVYFTAVERVVGTLLLGWSLAIGIAFGGRTFLGLSVIAFVASAGGIAMRRTGGWRIALAALLGVVALHLLATAVVPFYGAGASLLYDRLLNQGFSTARFDLYQSWVEQVFADPLGRPVVDYEIANAWWFHNLWMDVDRTSGPLAMFLFALLWVLPGAKLIASLLRSEGDVWPVCVAYGCVTVLVAFSVPLEGGNYGGLVYFSALAALAFAAPSAFDVSRRGADVVGAPPATVGTGV